MHGTNLPLNIFLKDYKLNEKLVSFERAGDKNIRIQDIKVGNWYRLKNTSGEYCDYYGWINVIDIYKRGDYRSPDKKKSLVKCRHVVNMNDTCGFIRYFSPSDIINTDECKRMNREYLNTN